MHTELFTKLQAFTSLSNKEIKNCGPVDQYAFVIKIYSYKMVYTNTKVNFESALLRGFIKLTLLLNNTWAADSDHDYCHVRFSESFCYL